MKPSVAEKQPKGCPKEIDLELFVLNHDIGEIEKRRIQEHLKACTRCREIYSEFVEFYKILEDELNKPVSRRVFELIREIGERGVP